MSGPSATQGPGGPIPGQGQGGPIPGMQGIGAPHHHHVVHHNVPPVPGHMVASVGHERLTEYLDLVRGEYEALQAECVVVKGQRDEFEKQSQ